MKHLILLIIVVLFSISAWSQRHVRTDSRVDWDINVLDKNILYPDAYFDLYMKRARVKDNTGTKKSYWKSGIFKRDSLIGIKAGYDFDLMSEYFEKSKGNTFRHWNRFRMGFYLIVNNSMSSPFVVEDPLLLVDAELTLSYLHIPQKLRGDQTLSKRKGYVEIFFSIRSSFDKYAYIGVKPWGRIWLKAVYKENRYARTITNRMLGLDIEILTNSNGYKNGTTRLTKDYYKGISFIVGSKFDLVTNAPYINLGIRLQTRNH